MTTTQQATEGDVAMVLKAEDYRALMGLLRRQEARRLTNVLQGARLNVSHHRGPEKSCPSCSLAQGRLVFKSYPEAFGGRQSWCLACRSRRTAGSRGQFRVAGLVAQEPDRADLWRAATWRLSEARVDVADVSEAVVPGDEARALEGALDHLKAVASHLDRLKAQEVARG